MHKRYLTSEAVTEGYPDKICDQIADSILDECLRQDPESRVACEVSINSNLIVVMGKIISKAVIDIPKVAKQVIKGIGYNKLEDGFDLENSNSIVSVKKQSKDIAKGVDKEKTGADNQGMVLGYATNELAEFMPYSLVYANKMAKRITYCRI